MSTTTLQSQVRTYLETAINAAFPGVAFFRSPKRELDTSELPAVCIYSHRDRPENGDNDDHQHAHPRVYTVRVEVRVSALGEEDVTDSYAMAIRKAVLADDSLGGLVSRVTWTSQEWDSDEADPPLSGTALDFNCFYEWRPEWPES